MVKCGSCGAENPPGRARCEYCDAALVATRHLDVSWSARSRDGTTGRGRLVVVAGGEEATGERVRAAAEAAFAAAVDAGHGVDQVQAAMQERLPALLPPGWAIESCLVEAVSAPGPAPAARAGGAPVAAPRPAGCKLPAAAVLLILGMVSGCCGLAGFLAGQDAAGRASKVDQARVVTLAEAAQATGMVCLEAQTAHVDSPLVVRGVQALCVETRTATERTVTRRDSRGKTTTRTERGPEETRTERVSGFGLGDLRVQVGPATRFQPLTPLGEAEEDEAGTRTTWSVFRADQPVTVVGMAGGGTLTADEVSAHATRAQLLDQLRSDVTFGRGMGLTGVVLAGLFLLAGVGALLKRGRGA